MFLPLRNFFYKPGLPFYNLYLVCSACLRFFCVTSALSVGLFPPPPSAPPNPTPFLFFFSQLFSHKRRAEFAISLSHLLTPKRPIHSRNFSFKKN